MTDPQAGGGAAGTFFDTRQRATIEAAMARIIPTDDRPGAREAGTIEFLDRYLSGLDFIYVGDVPGTTLVDWPISYADLEP
jgi:Gluconate 2-dehydrogenase subunit 3